MSDRRDPITAEGERFPPRPHALQYLAADPPDVGAAQPIADGVLWLRIPLPMELNHINVWLLDDGERWMLVDTGMAEEVCRDAWLLLEERVLGGRRLGRILVTHDHPDHMGLSTWLAERHGADLWMSEYAHRSAAEFLRADPTAIAERIRAFVRSHGIETSGALALPRGDHRKWFDRMAPLAVSPADGDVVAAGLGRWRIVETAGHCRGHLCLYDAERRLLISGDQVLPTISPNVSVLSSAPEADPLREFLASLERLADCDPRTLVLPSHGRPFQGLHRRIDDLAGHHRQQLAALRDFCFEPRTAAEVLPTMFRSVPRGFHRLLALGEAVAHLNFLCSEGLLRKCTDAAGIVRYASV
jgi:glyoxylase-like metal-dependent hydrolase (beta-lactamase superfamily II)